VYSPQNAKNLPVLVYIHGGGYGVGDGREDLSNLINANDDAFVAVSIQYRVSIREQLVGCYLRRHSSAHLDSLLVTRCFEMASSMLACSISNFRYNGYKTISVSLAVIQRMLLYSEYLLEARCFVLSISS
jgi:hypothetical protein